MTTPPTCPRCGAPLPAGESACPICEAPTELAPAPEAVPPDRARRLDRETAARRPSSTPARSRFPPGTVLAERYRIVSPLGKGGMGEVYRAEDLKLGQTVALKFLPPDLARVSAVRERLYQEVRLGRQISHPNVCRLYDVVEWREHLFVAMEYIDGEDLASLICRIGALPAAKALELAHEICAGLAAAHGLDVVHRDLKPANVMIDGRGRARITDFGLAVPAQQVPGRADPAGTPVYMAPEQLRGGPASRRSDLYALGLVLFEMIAGERLFDAATRAELLRQHERNPASDLAATDDSADPALLRVIARCLEERPEDRPASIHDVIAALPAGDPLQAALDAGETPPPELVAAAEGSGALRPAAALGALAVFLALLLANALFAERWGQVPGYVEVPEPPVALATRAGDLLRQAGVTVRDGDHAYGWAFDWDRRQWVAEHGFDWRGRGRTMAPSPAFLWYRYSPQPLDPFAENERVGEDDPPFDQPGMARLRLDAQGRLLTLAVVPPRRPAETGRGEPDWQPLLRATGLDPERLEPADPRWTPPVGATHRRAWTGTYPGQPALPVRVEAAAAAGRTVWLEVIPPWVVEAEGSPPPAEASRKLWEVALVMRPLLFLVLLATAALLARRNVRRDRGDRRGALRLALFVGATTFLYLVLRADFAPDAMLSQTIAQLGSAIAQGFVAWIVYLAIEPYLRRTWPRLMVGWHRLLSGRTQDPRVATEVLAGLSASALVAAVGGEMAVTLRIAEIPWSAPLETLGRFRDVVAQGFDGLSYAGIDPLLSGLVLLLATLVLRRKSLAPIGLWAVMFVIVGDYIFDLRYALGFKALVATVHVLVLMRFGMVGIATLSFGGTLVSLPLTLDPARWYFPHSLVPLLVLAALGGWAAWRALGEQPALARWLAEDRLPA